jgi:hypothetical protein
MKGLLIPILCLFAVQFVYGQGPCSKSTNNKQATGIEKESLSDLRCDSGGYYFDRGGRRMFETSYSSYKKGTFNLRRGHLWKDRSCTTDRCKRVRKVKSLGYHATKQDVSCYTEKEPIQHEHYSAQTGLTRWPSAPGPDNWQAGTSAFPYIATPIWLRDTTGASGYATPTSWQGFQ